MHLSTVSFLCFFALVVNSFAPALRLKLLVTKEINSTMVVMGPQAAHGNEAEKVVDISPHEEMLRFV